MNRNRDDRDERDDYYRPDRWGSGDYHRQYEHERFGENDSVRGDYGVHFGGTRQDRQTYGGENHYYDREPSRGSSGGSQGASREHHSHTSSSGVGLDVADWNFGGRISSGATAVKTHDPLDYSPSHRSHRHAGPGSMSETIRNNFRGRGPKNYQRSDDRIREDVCEILADHDFVDATDIDVAVSAGEVTLTGTVHDRRMKRLAEDVAGVVGGVKDVHNRLKVK